jgi:hypothetical protein
MWKNMVERGRPQMAIWRRKDATVLSLSLSLSLSVLTFNTYCFFTTTVVT